MSKNTEENLQCQAIMFDPDRYTKRTLALILLKAEQWKVSPLEAEVMLLNQLAEKEVA